MSSYTIRLKSLLDSGYNIWDSSDPYPIYSEAHRSKLNSLIEKHYYMQEIGFETPMVFKHYLNQRMREIMPKYNAMYESSPLFAMTVTSSGMTFKEWFKSHEETTEILGSETHYNDEYHKRKEKTGTNTDTTSQREENTGTNTDTTTHNYNYDTPMNFDVGSSGNNLPSGNISSATVNKNESGSTNNHTESGTQTTNNYTESGTQGNNGSIKSNGDNGSYTKSGTTYGKNENGENDPRKNHSYGTSVDPYVLIEKYRAFEFNIDKLIIDELADLFMMIF